MLCGWTCRKVGDAELLQHTRNINAKLILGQGSCVSLTPRVVNSQCYSSTISEGMALCVSVSQTIAQRSRVDREVQAIAGCFRWRCLGRLGFHYFMTSTASAAGSTLRSKSRAIGCPDATVVLVPLVRRFRISSESRRPDSDEIKSLPTKMSAM